MDTLHKHMKTLKTTWLGPEEKKASTGGQSSSVQAANATTVLMEITTDAPSPPHMPAIPQDDKIMNSPSAPSDGGDAPMHSPPLTFDMSGEVEESAMASPHAPSPRSPQVMEGPSLMSLVHAAPAASAGQVRVDDAPFVHHPYLDALNLVVNAEFRFLVCRLCKEGIAATAGRAHLVNKHPELLPTFDQERFQGIITSQLQVTTSLPTITGPRSKVHGLAEFDALACDHCGSIYTTLKSIRKHHGTEHKQVPAPQHWWSCRAQRMKPEGAGTVRQLWEVTSDDRGREEDSREKVLVDELLEELGEQLDTVQVPTDGRLVTPWLLTTRWNEWAKWFKKPTDKLRALVALPRSSTAEEEHYKMVSESIQLYFEEALALIDTTDELVLQRLNLPDPTKEGISNTPFHKHMHNSSMKKYVHPIICFFTMLLRDLWFLPDANMEITKLDDMLQAGSLDQSQLVRHIHAILLKVWTTPWSKNKFHIVPDPTESCLALLTLNHDGSFKAPKEVTTLIAKFEYCMRLTFLKEIRARASSDPEVDEADACDGLQPWFTEKNYSTFARLRSLQHRASAIAYSTMSLPCIWWTDSQSWSSLTYKGNPIAFSDVRLIFRDVEEKMVDIWENKVLRGLKLRVDYEQILDDPSERSVGYSFMFDPRNTCFRDRARLVRAVVNGQGGFSRFLLRQEDELVWNRAALRGWLQDYAEMQKLLLMRAEMLSGAPSRGSELTAMMYRNTQARDTRNLMVFGKHLTLLGQYSKMTALTGRDKLIPHALDALTSDLLVQDLALARPFAEIAAKICFGDDEEVTRLYRDHLFVNFNKAFTSDDLSAVMAKHSLPRVQYALTINPWRHVQTAWKRKFKCAMEDVVEMDMEDDVDSLQAGHTRATENRVYGLSTHSLAAAAEDVLPLFLQASTGWQERCQVMPGGSGLPYQQARSHFFIPKTSATIATATTTTTTTNTTATSQRNSSTSCATDDAMVDKIAARVTERLAPMLTDLIRGLTTKTGSTPAQGQGQGKGKGKQKDTTVEEESWEAPSMPPEEDDQSSKESYPVRSSQTLMTSLIIISLAPPASSPEGSATRRRVTPEQDPSVLALQKMQTLLRDDRTSWLSPQQKDAMMAILERKKDVIVMLPTGGGKSMLAIVPSLLEGNTVTILILPLNSLIMDYERRLTAMRVPYQVYQGSRHLNLQDNLVIVSADKSQTAHWRSSLADLRRRKEIARIVVDEAHIPLIAKGYCKSLENFYQVCSEPVPLVLLSATLPPIFMNPLVDMYRLLTDRITCRRSTNRPELAYILEKMTMADESESALATYGIEIVEEQAARWTSKDRGLVMVPSISMCTELAQDAGWHHFVGNREAMSGTDQQEQYQAWIEGRGSKVMEGHGKESRKQEETERRNEQAALDHLYLYGSKRCLRYGATLFTDGKGVGCHEDPLNKDARSAIRPGSPSSRHTMASIPSNRGADAEALFFFFFFFNWLRGVDHPGSFSQAARAGEGAEGWQEMGTLGRAQHIERVLQTALGTCCICLLCSIQGVEAKAQVPEASQDDLLHMPHTPTQRQPTSDFHESTKGKGGGMQRRAETYFETEWAGLGAFADWLMGVPRDEKESNLIELFLWYMEMEQR
ncbi:hypothetical protein F5141DRAFT_1216120 [Pisolithus sp. B1]|nr:hypothetical protein F5141DRAFT_1216120 [Pisolithus sp. B1]